MRKFKDRVPVTELCKWVDIATSSIYYKAHPGKRGMVASTHTRQGNIQVENDTVVEVIRRVLGQNEYCLYGYRIMTDELRGLGFLINPKKTYRLMKEHRLLCHKIIKTQGKRTWVEFRRINAEKPMEYLCLDIKYVWVQGEGRSYYQLAVMDVFSRMIVDWIFQPSIKQQDVITLMRNLDLRFGLKGVIIRNDNGSQFIAHRVRQTLQHLEAKQEFTHVATPEENAYIEAFHSIEQRELINRVSFSSFYDAKQHIEKYMKWYNYQRRHGRLKGLTPASRWAQGWACSPVRQLDAPDSVELSRPTDTYEKWNLNQSLDMSLDRPSESAYLCLTGEQEGKKMKGLVANPF